MKYVNVFVVLKQDIGEFKAGTKLWLEDFKGPNKNLIWAYDEQNQAHVIDIGAKKKSEVFQEIRR